MALYRMTGVEVLPEPYTLRVAWETGRSTVIDLFGHIHNYRIYRPLRDGERFRKVRLGNHGMTLDWGDDLDIPNDVLWRLALEQEEGSMTAPGLREWRERLRLSQDSAANLLGLSRRMIINYEQGKARIPKYISLACKGAEVELQGRFRSFE